MFLEQLYTFGTVDRDPRERVVSVAYYALVKLAATWHKAATDAANAQWFPISKSQAGIRPRRDSGHCAGPAKRQGALPAYWFRVAAAEVHLVRAPASLRSGAGKELDKRNFRKKVLGFGLLVPLKETQMAGRHRPAQLFRFDADKYEKLKKRGFNFEL